MEYPWLTAERVAPGVLALARRLRALSAPALVSEPAELLTAQCTRGESLGNHVATDVSRWVDYTSG